MTDNAATPHYDALGRALKDTEAAVGQALGAVFDPRAGLEQIKQRIRQAAQLPSSPAPEAQAKPRATETQDRPDNWPRASQRPGAGSPGPDRRWERGESLVAPVALKILVAGGFGVGKTTCIGAVSEIRPLHTEEMFTEANHPFDNTNEVEGKQTTTVAMDFGRVTLREDLVLYLFGTPGQDRFRFLWDELAAGALGAIVLADTRRLEDCFAALDYFEHRAIPFVIAVNCFDGATSYTAEEIHQALDLASDVPVVLCDVRRRMSVTEVLVTVVQHAMMHAADRHEDVTT